ncbi:MAG: metalloprotease TldD [Alphaproteobacteria bacterium]|nr:metalloprotease TldD [Alphaproteobacteria bacterium]
MFNKDKFSNYFAKKSQLDEEFFTNFTNKSLSKFADGELFLEYVESEKFVFDDGKLKSSSYNISSGFGLRGIDGELSYLAHSSDISKDELETAAKAITTSSNDNISISKPAPSNIISLYSDENPLIKDFDYQAKISLMQQIDNYLRSKHNDIKQVSVGIIGEFQVITVFRKDGEKFLDVRPLVRLNISVIAESNGRKEAGSSGSGGRHSYTRLFEESHWHKQADEAYRIAKVNLSSKPAPAGEMPVVLGSGWPGVLLHEAIGHGLEGDFNRKETSAFTGMIGKQVASKGVTVVDDGTLPERRGSLSIDDEGTKTSRTVLIEDGILMGYMQDRQNAALMNTHSTGNGRRESYACKPMPRMTNTYMLSGNATQEELIKSVKRGVFAVNFGGGQVDITSGKFVFSASEAYMIEDGKVTHPIKGASLIGNGPDCLTKITGIANDMELDHGVGTCGKNGQSVPVGVGQPSLLISSMTVGGTEI